MRVLCILLVLCVAMFIWSLPSNAAECGMHDKVVEFLGSKYKEHRHSMGLVSNRGVMELFSSHETGTWTMLLTNTKGISCIITHGENFHRAKPNQVNDPAT